MALNDLHSLQHAKAKQLNILMDRLIDGYFGDMFLKVDKFNSKGRIFLRQFNSLNKTWHSKSTLMHEDDARRLHYVSFDVPAYIISHCLLYSSNMRYDIYTMSWYHTLDVSSWIFDSICKMSNNGMKLVALKNNKTRKDKEIVVILDAYEGDKLQIEAELDVPSYSYLNPDPTPVPF